MSLLDWLILSILVFTLGAQLWRRSLLVRVLGYLFPLGVAAVFGQSVYWSYRLYESWKAGSVTQFFLPPHQGLGYFFSYAGYKFFMPWLISLLVALVVARIAEYLNKHLGERFFEDEEIGIMRLSFFLVGYPGIWFYIIFMLVAGLVLSIVYSLLSRGRAPFYYLWLTVALAMILAQHWLIPKTLLNFFVL